MQRGKPNSLSRGFVAEEEEEEVVVEQDEAVYTREKEEEAVFARENRGGSAQHATRATSTQTGEEAALPRESIKGRRRLSLLKNQSQRGVRPTRNRRATPTQTTVG